MSNTMAAPAAKKQKRIMENSDDLEALDSSPTNTETKLCIVCGDIASSSIVKDNNYVAMMQLYWCTLGIDVKPDACTTSDVCKKCFLEVQIYFETNDFIVFFETYFKSLRLNLLKKTLKGVSIWETEKRPLTRIHQEIRKKYGDEPDVPEAEQLLLKDTLAVYNIQTSIGEGDEPSTIKLKKPKDDTSPDKKKKAMKISLKSTSVKNANSGETSESEDTE